MAREGSPADETLLLFMAGDLVVRRIRDHPEDYATLSRWLSDPRLLEYYEGRDHPMDEEGVVAKYRTRMLGDEDVEPCFVLRGGSPIGYVQIYPAPPEVLAHLPSSTDAWAIDLFIGEPELWDQGIGTKLVTAVVEYLFEWRGAVTVTIDPRVDNPRAVRTYEKAGFTKLVVLPRHELHEGEWRDCWLLTVDRRRADSVRA